MRPTIPLGQFEARYPKCGSQLAVERCNVDPFAKDEFRCTACGTTFGKPEVERAALHQNRRQVEREATKAVDKMIRKAFGK